MNRLTVVLFALLSSYFAPPLAFAGDQMTSGLSKQIIKDLFRSFDNSKSALHRLNSFGIRFEMATPLTQNDYVLPTFEGVRRLAAGPNITFLEFEKPMLTTLLNIQEKFGRVVVDCAMFAQIAARLLSYENDGKSNVRIFAPGSTYTDRIAFYFERDFAYVQPADEEAYLVTRNAPFFSKGQWLLRVGPNRYLGLGKAGVKVASSLEWIEDTKNGLFEEIDDALEEKSSCQDFLIARSVERGVRLKKLRNAGQLNNWKLMELTKSSSAQ